MGRVTIEGPRGTGGDARDPYRFGYGVAASVLAVAVLLAPADRARAAGVADTVTVLPPVKVESTRSLNAGRETATTVKLDRSKVVKFLPSTANDALAAVPGVDLVKMGPWASSVTLRGMSGDRVLMMVDGVRVNGARGHGAQSSLVAMDKLDAVELQAGAGSAQYGSDAMGGVINFVTHRSLLDTRTSAGLSLQTRGATPGGSWNTSARFKYISPRVGFEIGGGLGGLEELVTAQGPIANSGDKEQFFSGRLALGLGRSVLDYEHTRNAATDIGLPAFSNSSGSYGRYPLQSRQADRLEWTLPGRGGAPDFKMLGVLQDFQTKFDESITDSVFNRGRFIAQRTEESKDDVGTWSWSVQPTLRYSRLANLRLNGEYRREVTSGPRMTETIVENAAGVVTSDTFEERESMPPAQRSVWSAGASIAPVVRTVRLEGGLRWDRLHSVADSTENSNTSKLDVTDERVSGEVGVARAFGGFEPYVHLATGFRAPNLQERYYNDDIHGGLRLFGNPDLSAERSTSYEAGLRLNDVGPFPSMRVSAYRSDVRDMITFEYIDMLYGTPRFQYLNVERARVQGVEAQAQLRTGALNWGFSVTLPHAEDLETGEPLTDAGTARTTVDLGFPVRRLLPMGQLAVRWRWNDAVISDDPTLARPSFHTTAVELSMIHAGVRAVFAVRNLFDAYYTEPLSFIPEAGRTFALSLRYDYNLALPLARND